MKQFEMDEARCHFSDAILLQPQSAQFHSYLGLTYAWQQQFSEAEKHFREALRLNPLLPEALANLAISLAHQGKWKEAQFYVERAIKLEPRAVGFHCHLALILGELGEPEAAAKEYQAASRMKPDWPQEASQHAWKFATNPQANHRNAGDALFLAKEACQATDSKPTWNSLTRSRQPWPKPANLTRPWLSPKKLWRCCPQRPAQRSLLLCGPGCACMKVISPFGHRLTSALSPLKGRVRSAGFSPFIAGLPGRTG
jgi:tetratricopeptide (TPR) repeat protein